MRNHFYLITTLFLFPLFSTYSQTLTIVDANSGKPIDDVFVYHENKKNVAYSDGRGKVKVDQFKGGVIYLQHPSYHEEKLEVPTENRKVEMMEKIISFNEVVVSANKWEQEEEQVAQQILSINKKSIAFDNPQTSADLLANSGQVFVQKSQLGGGSPKIRGFAANSVLLVVDGVRMNNAIFRSGNLQNIINIDANALESTEVIFGPGSVLYGSDALGGVMDFHTIDPKWMSEGNTLVKTNAMVRYSSAAKERTGHMDVSVAQKNLTFYHSSSYTSFDDLRAGAWRTGGYEGEFERRYYVQRVAGEDILIPNDDINLQRFSGYNLLNTISKAKVKLSNKATLGYGFYYSTTSDIPRYDNLTEESEDEEALENAEWYYGPQKWQMHQLNFKLFAANALFDQARATMAYQAFKESRNDRGFGDERLRTRTETVDVYSFTMDMDKEWSSTNLYYGFDFYYNDVTSEAFRTHLETGAITSATPRYPDGGSNYTAFAAYTSATHDLSPSTVLSAGVRYNRVILHAETTDSTAISNEAAKIDLHNGALNGSLGLALNTNEKTKLSYYVSSGFRAPNVDDVGKIFEVGSSLDVPNPDLRPEYSLSNELSYQWKGERSRIQAVAFYSQLFDAIVDVPSTLNGNSTVVMDGDTLNVFSKDNSGQAYVYGGSIVLQAEIGTNIGISQTLNYTTGWDVSNDEPLRHTTPLFGKTSITYRKDRLRAELFAAYNGNMKRADIPSSEIDEKPYLYTASGSPGWYTINLKTSYQVNAWLLANVGAENLLDKHYRTHTSGISAPGRNLILTLRASF